VKKHTITHRIVPIAAALALGGGIGAAVYAGLAGGSGAPSATTAAVVPTTTVQPAASTTTTSSLTTIYKNATPGVVDITVTEAPTSNGFGLGQQSTTAEGTGFVFDTKGDIVTAAHVVDGATSVKVKFKSGKVVSAKVLGIDNSTDTAVIKVDVAASDLHPLPIGSSAAVLPGDEVVAIGSPFGLTETMTAGIVSAIGRTITAPNQYSISGAIQTDAPINHGNSGGPLLDASGAVVGVNVQIDSNSDGSEGVGFATPIDTVKSVASTIISGGTVEHAYLGISVGDAANDGGAQVSCVVSGSPADNAGMKAGDVITAVGSTTITNADDLTAAVNTYKPGAKVTMTVNRNGSSKSLSVTFGNRPASATSCL
jgi:putative serine protease PepD